MTPRSYIKSLLAVALCAMWLPSCHNAIMSDLTDCPQYTDFSFFVRTPDEVSYPDSKIDEVRVFAFDESGALLGEWLENEVAFTDQYRLHSDYFRPGTTSFVAWAGKDLEQYDFSAFVKGAKKEELVMLMAKQSDRIAATAGPLYVGEPETGSLTQTDREGKGTFTDQVRFPLVQITNHFDITVNGLEKGHQYTISYTAKNSRYSATGQMLDDTKFEWTTERFTSEENEETITLHAEYDVLRMVSGVRGDYLVQIKDETGAVVYEFDPLHDFILNPATPKGWRDDLDLNHDFTIRVDLQEHIGTYYVVQAWIMNWNIVFRQEEL